jgi:hypothetical protein
LEHDHASNGSSSSSGAAATSGDELSRLRAAVAEQEAKWRQSFETIARENEILRSKGGESLLATQWRGRYEACMKEKEDLAERLATYGLWTSSVTASGKSMDQAYIELQEEFRTFRKKLASIDRRRQRNTTSAVLNAPAEGDAAAVLETGVGTRESEISALIGEYEASAVNHSHNSHHASYNHNGYHTNGSHSSRHARGPLSLDEELGNNNHTHGADGSSGMTASKIKYVRHMVLQYLACKEPEVKQHIETALMTIFRMTPEEREVIESKRKEDATDALSSISSFLGMST